LLCTDFQGGLTLPIKSLQRIVDDIERGLRVPQRPSVAPAPLTDQERAEAAKVAARSLTRTRRVIDSALSEPCMDHGAALHAYCYSSVKGICKARRERGLFLLEAIPSIDAVGELEPLANAVRNANRNRKYRERYGRPKGWRG
jgi:hypothetical protein